MFGLLTVEMPRVGSLSILESWDRIDGVAVAVSAMRGTLVMWELRLVR